MRALVSSAFAVLATAAPLVTGCSPAGTLPNRGLESVHQPVVARTDYAIDIRSSFDGLAMGEERRLTGWFDTLKIGYGDRITVDDGAQAARASRDAVALVAARYGLLLGETPPITAGPVPSDAIRVVVSRSTASVPGCPDWAGSASGYDDGSIDTNYGCASNTNLAMMVADPQDLIEGRHGRSSLSTRASTRALKAYNELIPTGVTGTVKAEATGGAKQ